MYRSYADFPGLSLMFGYRQLGVYVQRDKLLEHVFGVVIFLMSLG